MPLELLAYLPTIAGYVLLFVILAAFVLVMSLPGDSDDEDPDED